MAVVYTSAEELSTNTLGTLAEKGYPVSEDLKKVVHDFYYLYEPRDTDERFELGIHSIKHHPWQSYHYWSECVGIVNGKNL